MRSPLLLLLCTGTAAAFFGFNSCMKLEHCQKCPLPQTDERFSCPVYGHECSSLQSLFNVTNGESKMDCDQLTCPEGYTLFADGKEVPALVCGNHIWRYGNNFQHVARYATCARTCQSCSDSIPSALSGNPAISPVIFRTESSLVGCRTAYCPSHLTMMGATFPASGGRKKRNISPAEIQAIIDRIKAYIASLTPPPTTTTTTTTTTPAPGVTTTAAPGTPPVFAPTNGEVRCTGDGAWVDGDGTVFAQVYCQRDCFMPTITKKITGTTAGTVYPGPYVPNKLWCQPGMEVVLIENFETTPTYQKQGTSEIACVNGAFALSPTPTPTAMYGCA